MLILSDIPLGLRPLGFGETRAHYTHEPRCAPVARLNLLRPRFFLSAGAKSSLPEKSCLAQLARFFPQSTPVRLPVRLVRLDAGGTALSEDTVIEYGTPREVLFASRLPWEFGDRLQLRNADGSLDVQGAVVAVQYQDGATAVAARFLGEMPNWIVKP